MMELIKEKAPRCCPYLQAHPILKTITWTKHQRIRTLTLEEAQALMDFLKEHIINYKPTKPEVSLTDVAAHTGISKQSLYTYIHRLTNDPSFNPKREHSYVNRAMSDSLEFELIMEIERKYITPGNYFNNKILKLLALAMWETADPKDKLQPSFKATDKWCRNFRNRYNYVWRKARAIRETIKTKEMEDRATKFTEEIRELYRSQHANGELHLLVNVDETNWRLCYAGDLTWAKKGASDVKIKIQHDTKEALTTLASVTAGGDLLPLYILAKGKTKRCEINQIKGVKEFDYQTDHSPSGWTTSAVMERYLTWLRTRMDEHHGAEGKTIHLLLDVYRAHTCQSVRDVAAENNIILHFIPAGYTSTLQPLDVKVFGALKAKARGYWYQHYSLTPGVKHTKKSAVRTLLSCWSNMTRKLITGAWRVYEQLLREEEADDNCIMHPSANIANTGSKLVEALEEMKYNSPKLIRKIIGDEISNPHIASCEVRSVVRNEQETDEPQSTCEDETDQEIEAEEDECEEDEEDASEIDSGEIELFENTDDEDIGIPIDFSYNPLREIDLKTDIPPKIIYTPMTGFPIPDITIRSHVPVEANPETTHQPNRIPNIQSVQITTSKTLHNCELIYANLSRHISFERGKASSRSLLAINAKQKAPDIPDTIGITNIGRSCAFNSFMQLLYLMPNARDMLRQPDRNTFDLEHLARATLEKMEESYRTIEMRTFAHALRSKYGAKAKLVVQTINNIDQSVIGYISHCIDIRHISFTKNGIRQSFLSINPYDDVTESLKGVDLNSFGEYVFLLTSNRKIDFEFPWELEMQDQHVRISFVLKGFVSNPPKHFIAYIRQSFTHNIIQIDDSVVNLVSHEKIKYQCLALYLVHREKLH